MFPKRVKYMLTFFDAFGYNSGSSKLSSHRKVANLIGFLHLLLAIFFTCFTFYAKIQLSPSVQFLELLNHLLQYSSQLCQFWFTIWDSFHHWREHHRFWAVFEEIDKSFQSQNNFTCRLFMLKLFSIILATILSLLLYYLVFDTSSPHMNEILINQTILMKLCQFRIFYYLFCLEIINFQLKSIENALKKMNAQMNFPSIGNLYHFKWVQQYYRCVYEMSNLSNDIFDWSQIAAVIFCFYTFLTDLNWFCVHFSHLQTAQFLGKC